MSGGDITSSIVKYTRKDGNTYAYESIAKWDSRHKQSRPVRRYLGRVDPVSGEIIPSSGRPGRPKGSKNKPRANSEDESQGAPQGTVTAGVSSSATTPADDEVRALKGQISTMQSEMDTLRKRTACLETAIRSVVDQLSRVIS